jgi:hypothetical protein
MPWERHHMNLLEQETRPAISYREIPLTQGQVTLVDASDFDWLSRWKWHAYFDPKTRTFVAKRKERVNGKWRSVFMHKEILGLKHGDKRRAWHMKNGATLDNRRSNLYIGRTKDFALARFMRYVDKSQSGCWLWTGNLNDSGYAVFGYEGSWLAHRWAYQFIRGLDPGLELHHVVCKTRRCVNPEHVESVQPDEHPDKPSVINRTKQQCPQGHPYSGDNLYIDKIGNRHCRKCRRAAALRDWQKHHAARRHQQDQYYQKHKDEISARRRKKG